MTFNELKRIEAEFWEKFSKDQQEEMELLGKLCTSEEQMQTQYSEIRPLFEIMDEKIHASEFYDIIENKSRVSSFHSS